MQSMMTEAQLAEHLQVTPAALRKWRQQGRGPRFIRIGRLVRYRAADVTAYLESNAIGGEPDTRPPVRASEHAGLTH